MSGLHENDIDALAERLARRITEGSWVLPTEAADFLQEYGGHGIHKFPLGHGAYPPIMELTILPDGGLHLTLRTPDHDTLHEIRLRR